MYGYRVRFALGTEIKVGTIGVHALVTNATDDLLAPITCGVVSGIGSQTITHLRGIERDVQLVRFLKTYHEVIDIANFDKSVVGMLLWCYLEAR